MTKRSDPEYMREYRKIHLDKIRETANASYHKHKDDPEKTAYKKAYYQDNKEIIKERKKIWRANNKEKNTVYNKQWKKDHPDKVKEQEKEHNKNHKNEIKEYNKKYKTEHKVELKRLKSLHRDAIKIYEGKPPSRGNIKAPSPEERKRILRNRSREERETLLTLLGGKCISCGETKREFLTLDHINNDGYRDKKNGTCDNRKFIKKYKVKGWPLEEIKEKFQILCYNCNFTKTKRIYFDLPYEEQTYKQRYNFKLWKEAFNFFGPCQICGCNNLKFLSIDHINGGGNKKRKEGEGAGSDLLSTFRERNWEESIKEEYRLLCFNCNCVKKII